MLVLPLRAATSPTGNVATSARSTPTDRQGSFDVPHLNNIYDSAPYLHNGIANTLEEIWTRLQPVRHARGDERPDEGPAERPHRVPEDAVRDRHAAVAAPSRTPPWRRAALRALLALSALPTASSPAVAQDGRRRRRRCPTSTRSGSTSPSRTACPTTTSSRSRWTAPACGSAPRTASPCIDKPRGKVVKTWQEKDGLPFRVVTAIDVDKKTGDVWLGLFGGGLARLSGGRFDHWHQLNSGLVNDVVYGVAVENDNVWARDDGRRLAPEHGHRTSGRSSPRRTRRWRRSGTTA